MKQDYTIDAYMQSLFQTVYNDPFAKEKADNAQQVQAVCAKLKNQLQSVFSLQDIPGRLPKIQQVCVQEYDRGTYIQKKLAVTFCENLTMPVFLLIPKNIKDKTPCTVALCGHGYGVRQIVNTQKNGKPRKLAFFDDYQKHFAVQLAEKGCIVAAPELFGFGEMKLQKDMKIPFYSSSCKTVSSHLLPFGSTTASMRILQAVVCADLLLQMPQADADRLGIMGISGGGLTALYAAVSDERFRRICISGYINSFRTSILKVWHCPDNYFPDIIKYGDIADFACTLAPRVLVTESGKKDRLFPIDGSLEAIEKIRRIYSLLDAENNFTADVFDGKHRVNGEKSFSVLSE